MGTTQSHSQKRHRDKEGYSAGPSDVTRHPAGKSSSPRGKPSPPSQPLISDVTHCSVTLSWQPPRRNSGGTVFAYTIEMSTPADPKEWTVVTKSCQGTRYQVKNLEPSSQYMFRVRGENIHGLSKGSRSSEVVETKMFGVEQQVFIPAPEDRVSSVPVHQHSINLHLEGTVTSILNHTDIKVKANSLKEGKVNGDREGRSFLKGEGSVNEDEVDGQGRRWRSSSLQRDGYLRSSAQSDRVRSNSLQRDANGRSSLQAERWRSNSLQREAYQRSSLQPSRKRSLPIVLPGTRTDSLNKLRDSQTFPVTMKSRINETSAMGRKRGQTWRERSASDAESSVSGSKEDIVDGKTCSSKDVSNTDDDLKPAKRDSGLEEDADNPWEKDDSSSEASDGVLSTTLSEDKKMEVHSAFPPDTPASGWMGVSLPGVVSPAGESGQADFRTLRSLLHSDDIIVKAAHSLPDMVGSLGRKISPHNTLTTILDLEEEEDSVRITTL